LLGLLVIDMQRGLFEGSQPRHDREGVVHRINTLAGAVRQAKGTVVFIQHQGPVGDDFAPDTPGWELLPDLQRSELDLVVAKRACDSFYESDLEATLASRSIRELLITGCATYFCVDTTLRAAASRDYLVTAVEDGHTTADWPHLDAVSVIRHHNWVWAALILPRSQVRVRKTRDLVEDLAAEAAH
jgi:nicotinamidase-related amidase